MAENAINQVKKLFPKQADHFFVYDMTQRHYNIPDNYYDHVLKCWCSGNVSNERRYEKSDKRSCKNNETRRFFVVYALYCFR